VANFGALLEGKQGLNLFPGRDAKVAARASNPGYCTEARVKGTTEICLSQLDLKPILRRPPGSKAEGSLMMSVVC
jgi:hypothetical protein